MKLILKIFFNFLLVLMFIKPLYGFDLNHLEKIKNQKNCIKCDLTYANLQGMNLSNLNFSGSNFSHSDLRGVDFSKSN